MLAYQSMMNVSPSTIVLTLSCNVSDTVVCIVFKSGGPTLTGGRNHAGHQYKIIIFNPADRKKQKHKSQDHKKVTERFLKNSQNPKTPQNLLENYMRISGDNLV